MSTLTNFKKINSKFINFKKKMNMINNNNNKQKITKTKEGQNPKFST